MIDLSTTYLGLALKTPLVASASPLCQDLANIRRMEDAGAGAVVLPSLFEEQIDFADSLGYFSDLTAYDLGPDEYLEHVRRAKAAVSIPVIASLNGVSSDAWTSYTHELASAGADALELNLYYIPADGDVTGADVEQSYVELVRDVTARVRIPVAVKLGSAFTAMANVARRLDQAGARGLVLFNRFYQPDFALEGPAGPAVVPRLTLSSPAELGLRLHWVAILFGRVRADLAVTGGVHTAEDVLKAMVVGARVAMMTSALLKHGIEVLKVVRANLVAWMEAHEQQSIRPMQGSRSYGSVADPAEFERASYLKVLRSHGSGA